ncbi:MAG: hypothetical protein A2287_06265 [Candidatus Melainabacteria bacterium RIFOXYA12_FULL_32_12]|nr:MAG: hypothetical protein A2255_01865 [Candidatus Melainabacteria bacterium RIFOXYA2_FULL_32_9]OGI31025.1 MAG: hypothetical protein A2287_06265 [Candidatus Melainabacteria bacterium RIFOXYA12_FULL_32_12]
MGKKKRHAEEHENLERWLVSYADFITLLFATFVVLYALSQLDLAKFKDLKVSLQRAFSGSTVIQGGDGVLEKAGENVISQGADNTSVVPFFEHMQAKAEEKTFTEVKEKIEELKGKNELEGVDTRIDERGLVINLVDSLFFNSGSAEIKKQAYPALRKIGYSLREKFADHSIRVEGHTDNIPIQSSIYPSNWELSSARASSVIRFMIGNFDFSKAKFSALGYADSVPIALNDSLEGRSKNRRVEIVVLRNRFVKSEPRKLGNDKEKHKKPEEKPKQNNKNDKVGQISEAAKKLMQGTGQTIQDVLLYQDSYDKESERLAKELELMEKQVTEKH